MSMTLEQVRDWHRDIEKEHKYIPTISEAHKAAADAIDARLSRQFEGVSDEDVQIAFNAMDDHFTKSTPYRGQISDEDKAIAMEGVRAALTAVRHNRPAQEKEEPVAALWQVRVFFERDGKWSRWQTIEYADVYETARITGKYHEYEKIELRELVPRAAPTAERVRVPENGNE